MVIFHRSKCFDNKIVLIFFSLNEKTCFGHSGRHFSCANPEGGPGVWTPPPLKSHKKYRVPGSPEKSQSYQNDVGPFNVGPSSARQENVSWQADDGMILVVFGSTKKKCQGWNPSEKTFWIRTCFLCTHNIGICTEVRK